MSIIIHLSIGILAAIITAAEYILSTIAALSARATLHGFWLLGLHRGGEAALDPATRTRRAFRKDLSSFLLSLFLVIAAAGVETSLQPTWLLQPYAINTTACVSVFGTFKPMRVTAHSPPFRVSVEPWIICAAQTLKCRYGIATIGVGSWSDLSGRKMDMAGPTCVNTSLNLSTRLVGANLTRYKFEASFFNPVIGESSSYTLFPLNPTNLGKGTHAIGTTLEGQGPCGTRGISSYFMAMNARYETSTMHATNMTFGIHQRICSAHGTAAVRPLTLARVEKCMRKRPKQIDVLCFLDSTTSEERYSIRLHDFAALYVNHNLTTASYACVNGTVEIAYIFITAELAKRFMPASPPQSSNSTRPAIIPPTLPVLIPTTATSISGTCERTIAPIAQSALLFSMQEKWSNTELAKVERQTRFHAFMMAVSDSLFPLPNLQHPESSLNNGTCYVRPCSEVTAIPWAWASILLVVCVCLVIMVTLSAAIFRLFFRGESWLVGSARWSLSRLLGGGGGDGQTDQEALIEAVPIAPEPGFENSLERRRTSFRWGKRSTGFETRDWKYEFRVRKKYVPNETTQANSVKPLTKGDGSSQDRSRQPE